MAATKDGSEDPDVSGALEDLAQKLAEALRDVMAADPDLPGYRETMDEAERVLGEAQRVGLISADE